MWDTMNNSLFPKKSSYGNHVKDWNKLDRFWPPLISFLSSWETDPHQKMLRMISPPGKKNIISVTKVSNMYQVYRAVLLVNQGFDFMANFWKFESQNGQSWDQCWPLNDWISFFFLPWQFIPFSNNVFTFRGDMKS